MNTNLLMGFTALYLGLTGVVLSFLPHEILEAFAIDHNVITVYFIQLLSALYLGLALLNLMSRGGRIGGIYNRPVVLANTMYFGVSSIALLKSISGIEMYQTGFIVFLCINTALALAFVYVFKTNPK